MHITSQFSEAQYQAFIESSFIEDFRKNNQVDIFYYSGTSEKLRGYDIQVMTFIPIFLQMKRSDCYLKFSTNSDMIARKDQFHYSDTPACYFFHLHVDNETKSYMQHNLLVSLCNENNYARYIAPLFVEHRMLMNLKYNIPPTQWNKIYHFSLRSSVNSFSWREYLNFPHSILIKPHENQTKENGIHHKYFFNRAKQISFHSEPQKIVGGDYFQQFINQITSDINKENSENLVSLRKIFGNIINALNMNFDDQKELLKSEISFIEENITFEKLESLNDMPFSENNFLVLTRYMDIRFGIKTILVGAKDHNFYFQDYI